MAGRCRASRGPWYRAGSWAKEAVGREGREGSRVKVLYWWGRTGENERELERECERVNGVFASGYGYDDEEKEKHDVMLLLDRRC